MGFEILQGDCIERMAEMEEASVDAVVCDPPAGIAFMGKSWDRDRGGRDRWVEWLARAMAEALRVCKPGAHAFVWAIPRTSHWTALALEDAGWEIRDRIAHHFGSGFPKNKDLGDGVGTALKPATEDWWLARKPFRGSATANHAEHGTGGLNIDACRIGTEDDTQRPPSDKTLGLMNDDGWVPKPVETGAHAAGRVPANVVLSHAEDCEQVGTTTVSSDGHYPTSGGKGKNTYGHRQGYEGDERHTAGESVEAWECAPGCPVAELDLQSGRLQSGRRAAGVRTGMGFHGANGDGGPEILGDSGGASRFFYCAKTSRAERNAGLEGFAEKPGTMRNAAGRPLNPLCDNTGRRIQVCDCGGCKWSEETNPKSANYHPTVKPINLMRWLVRLVTPPGGLILDPFLGSGTTGCAAALEGFDFIGIEREPEYIAIAQARISFWSQHEGREVEDVLKLHSKSTKAAKEHEDRGQEDLFAMHMTVDDVIADIEGEAAA